MTCKIKYYDKEGRPMDRVEWAKVFGNEEFQVINQTTIGPYRISTVWLGLDHSFGDHDTPLIFETMIFADNHEHFDGEMWRYSTIAKARMGHKAACRLVNEKSLSEAKE